MSVHNSLFYVGDLWFVTRASKEAKSKNKELWQNHTTIVVRIFRGKMAIQNSEDRSQRSENRSRKAVDRIRVDPSKTRDDVIRRILWLQYILNQVR